MVTYETRDQASRQAGERRRAELGKFLKARRATLSPGDFGLPPGSRRRTPGLRREEVALLAGVGVTWYTWLEQGRQINASTQVLDAVARTLRLGRAEREHLYRLAEATPLRTECARTAVPDTIREIVHSLEPLPAILINSRFDILLSNDASEELFWEWHTMPCVHKNTLWCCVTEPSARSKFPQYEQHVRYLVARFRSAYALHVGDPDWEEDIRRLASMSCEFAELWAQHEVADSAAAHADLPAPAGRVTQPGGQRARPPAPARCPHPRLHPRRPGNQVAAVTDPPGPGQRRASGA